MIERQLSRPDCPEFCQLRYHPTPRLLSVLWQGHVTAEMAHEGALAALDILHRLPCRRLLNDNTHLRGPWFGSMLWLAQQWAPAAVQAGVRYVAHVVRAGTLATTFLATPTHQLFTQFEIQIFDSRPEAESWLDDSL